MLKMCITLMMCLGPLVARATCTESIVKLIDDAETQMVYATQKNNTTVYCNSTKDYGWIEYFQSETLADIADFHFDSIEVALSFADPKKALDFKTRIAELSQTEKGRRLALWAVMHKRPRVTSLGFRISNMQRHTDGEINLNASAFMSPSFEQQIEGILMALQNQYILKVFFDKPVWLYSTDILSPWDINLLKDEGLKEIIRLSPDVDAISISRSWHETDHLSVSRGVFFINPNYFEKL